MRTAACIFCLLLVVSSVSSAGNIDLVQKQGNPQEPRDGIKIAILEFQILTEASGRDVLGKACAEAMATALANTGRFSVVERAQLAAAVKELQMSMSGAMNSAEAKQAGKLAGADAILTGSIIRMGADMRVDARIIGVETGEVLAAEKAMGKADLEGISAMAETLAKKFLDRIYRDKR